VDVISAEFDSDTLDRFADAGAASDLHLDFVTSSPEIDIAPPPSSPPPRAFDPDEPDLVRSGKGRLLTLALVALAVLGLTAYLLSTRKAAPSPAAKTTATPPVTATTVDVPPAPPPASVPAEPTLPAPTPSRPASGAASTPPVRVITGRLLIRTTPADATVTINGAARGKTPLTLRDLALGSYTIHVARDGFTAADRRVRLTARRPSDSLEISLKPVAVAAPATGPGRLSVDTRPPGARVFVNGQLVGSTPLVLPDLPAGPAAVRIEMDGYQLWSTTVRVNAGEQTRVTASLDRK
jgi:hypothetical protein